MGNLGRHAHRLASFNPMRDRIYKIIIFVMRQTAYAEGFNDQSGIRWKKSIQYFPVNPWNQFEQKNLLIHLMIKHQWLGGLVFVINIKNDLLIVNGCNIGDCPEDWNVHL